MAGQEHSSAPVAPASPRRRRWGLVALALLGIAVVSAAGFTRSQRFNDFLQVQAENLLRTQLVGRIQLERVEGSIWSELSLTGLELFEEDDRVFRAARVTLVWSPWSVLSGTLRIARCEIDSPQFWLAQDPDGSWNLPRALTVRNPSTDEGEPGLSWRISSLEIRDASADVRRAAAGPISIETLNALASLRQAESGLVLELARAGLTVRSDELPPLVVHAEGEFISPADGGPKLTLDALSLESERSRLELVGAFVSGESVDLSLRIGALAPEDIERLIPDFTLREPVEGNAQLSGAWNAAQFTAELNSAGAQLRASAKPDLDALELGRLDAEAELTHANLAALFAQAPLAGVVNASAVSKDGAVAWRFELQEGTGSLTGEGSLTLAQIPEYQAVLSAEDLDPAALLPGRPDLAGEVDLRARVAGRGTSSDDLTGTAGIELGPSRLGGLEIAHGGGDVAASAGLLRIPRFEFETRNTRVSLSGTAELADAGDVDLVLTAKTQDVGPLLSLFDRDGEGAVEWSGSLVGPRSGARLRGEGSATALRVDSFDVETGSLQLDFDGVGAPQIEGEAHLELTGVTGPVALSQLRAVLRATPGSAQGGRLELRAVGTEADALDLVLEGVREKDGASLVLHALTGEFLGETWALAQPAPIDLRGSSLHIKELTIASGTSRLQAHGTVGNSGTQDLAIELRDLPLGLLASLLPRNFELGGRLDGELRTAGTGARPEVAAELRVRELALDGQPLERLVASLQYREELATAELHLQQDAQHELRIDGRLPLRLGWAKGIEARVLGDPELHALSSGFDLAFFQPFTSRHAKDLAGELAIDMTLRGPLERPVSAGHLTLRNGSVTPALLGVPLREIVADASFGENGIHISSLRASSGEGRLEARGDLLLRKWVPRTLDASITLTNWPAIATRSYRARVEGELSAEGDLAALGVKGRLHVQSGTLRPDIEFLTDRPLTRDETIVFAPDPHAPEPPPAPRPPQAESPIYAGATLDLDLSVERNLWIKHENASIELSGALRATKAPQEDPRLAGEIQSVRGWVELQGRRFRMQEGTLAFTGGKTIDPTLDAVARYKLPDYTIDVVVTGTALAPKAELRSDPELEQADILAVLLFGKPAKELGQGEQQTLGQQAGSLAASLGIKELARSVERAIGLSSLGIQVEEISESRAALGAYLNEKTYVTLSQELSGEQAQRFTVEYELWPGWSIVGSSSTLGESSGDVVWKKRY